MICIEGLCILEVVIAACRQTSWRLCVLLACRLRLHARRRAFVFSFPALLAQPKVQLVAGLGHDFCFHPLRAAYQCDGALAARWLARAVGANDLREGAWNAGPWRQYENGYVFAFFLGRPRPQTLLLLWRR